MYKADTKASLAIVANRCMVRKHKADRIMSNTNQSFAFRLAALNTMSLENRVM